MVGDGEQRPPHRRLMALLRAEDRRDRLHVRPPDGWPRVSGQADGDYAAGTSASVARDDKRSDIRDSASTLTPHVASLMRATYSRNGTSTNRCGY
jgi:hypothetical protein